MLHIAPRGFLDTPWAEGFYPADMPPEWRFDYFSNEADAVLLPAAGLLPATAVRWRGAAPAGFAFFLEVADGCPTDELLRAFGPALRGFVVPPGGGAVMAAANGIPLLRLPGERAVLFDRPPQPRAIRAEVERLLDRGGDTLFVADGPAAMAVLQQARVIAQLLGA